jgi:hypothetical protein
MQTAQQQQSQAGRLPLFYKNPVQLSRARHGRMSFKPLKDYSYAREVNSVPVHIGEFPLIVRHYPIVFTKTSPVLAVAILGIGKGQNLFVDAEGHWKEETYIPAYVRRYPFILQDNPLEKKLALCIDEGADAFEMNGNQPFFQKDDISEVTRRALNFCDEFRALMEVTKTFCEFLEKDDLLVEKSAEIKLAKGETRRLQDFRIIDEEKFDKLPDKRILQYRKRKFLHPVYLQMVSINNWMTLSELASRRG